MEWDDVERQCRFGVRFDWLLILDTKYGHHLVRVRRLTTSTILLLNFLTRFFFFLSWLRFRWSAEVEKLRGTWLAYIHPHPRPNRPKARTYKHYSERENRCLPDMDYCYIAAGITKRTPTPTHSHRNKNCSSNGACWTGLGGLCKCTMPLRQR